MRNLIVRIALWAARDEIDRMRRNYEGRIRYLEFHKDAATGQRMSVVKELRKREAEIARSSRPWHFQSRMGFARLGLQLARNRRA